VGVSVERCDDAGRATGDGGNVQPYLEDSQYAVRVSVDRFEQAVRMAIEAIPAEYQPYLEDIEFVIARRSPDGLLGYYEGGGALDEVVFPARVTIFKETHEDVCDTWEALVEEVRRTVLHEVGHHFLMEEDEMPY